MEEHIIDASILEGGGQIFRISLGLASLINFKCNIHSIRNNRPNPGLAKQHLTITAIIESLGFGKIEGNYLGSPNVIYIPRKLSLINRPSETVRIVKDIGSAGSISLIIQALLPYFIFQSQTTSLVLTGGTNVSFSPPIDHVELVLLPLLSRMGVEASVEPNFKRGYYPLGGGKVELNIRGLSSIQPLICLERGKIQSIYCVIFGSEHELMDEMKINLKTMLEQNILQYFNTLNDILVDNFEGVTFQITSSSSNQKKSNKQNDKKKSSRRDVSLGVQISIRTSTNNILSVNSLVCEKDPNIITTFPERITSEVLHKIQHLIESNCCIDEQTADQLLIYLALASSSNIHQKIGENDEIFDSQVICSQILCEPFIDGQSSLHLETSITLLNHILGSRGCNIRLETDPISRCRLITCQGINFVSS